MCAYQSRRPHTNTFGQSGYRATNNVASPGISRPLQQQQQQQPTPPLASEPPVKVVDTSLQPSVSAAPVSPSPVATSADPPLVIDGKGGRILCVSDVRGNLKILNVLAAKYNAQAIVHTGDFGFYTADSLARIGDKPLRHLVQYSSLISEDYRIRLLAADQSRGPSLGGSGQPTTNLRTQISNSPSPVLSDFPLLLDGRLKFDVPVFAVWGACEDVAVIERIRAGEYQIPNLQILDEATTRAIDVGDIRLRLYGLGGAVVLHKLFDNGDGAATIAGGQGLMWTTMLQIGELVDTAQKTYDHSETRILITHASPGREGLLAQLAMVLKADMTISAGLHFRYGISYNDFAVQHDSQNYRNKMTSAKAAFSEIWDGVKTQVEEAVDPQQRILLDHALGVTNRLPSSSTATGAVSEEFAWKNTWNWNLPDVAHGSLVLDINEGRLGAETFSAGFDFAFRRAATKGGLNVVAAVPQTATNPTAVTPTFSTQSVTAAPAVKTDVASPVYSAVSAVPQPSAARPQMGAAAPSRPTGGLSSTAVGRMDSPRATPPSAGPSPGVRPAPTGPASSGPGSVSLTGIKSPPMGPRGYQHHPQQGSPLLYARGGRFGGSGLGRASGAFANGSASATDSDAKDVGIKKHPRQPKQEAAASTWDDPITRIQTSTDAVKSAGNATGGAEIKTRKPRPPKKGKGGVGAGATLAPPETSGAEVLTSGTESAGQNSNANATTTKKDGPRQHDGRRKDKGGDQQTATPRTSAAPAAATPATATTGAAVTSETHGVKASGDETSAPSTGVPGISRGGRNAGRGGRGARGRGGRGGRGAGLGGSASDSPAPAAASTSSAAATTAN